MKKLMRCILAILLSISIHAAPAQVVTTPDEREAAEESEQKRSMTTIFAAVASFLFGATYIAIKENEDKLDDPEAPETEPASDERSPIDVGGAGTGGGSPSGSPAPSGPTRRTRSFQAGIIGQLPFCPATKCSYDFFGGGLGSDSVSVTYEEDANGNIRIVSATYSIPGGNPSGGCEEAGGQYDVTDQVGPGIVDGSNVPDLKIPWASFLPCDEVLE